jgi:hypothetical protein
MQPGSDSHNRRSTVGAVRSRLAEAQLQDRELRRPSNPGSAPNFAGRSSQQFVTRTAAARRPVSGGPSLTMANAGNAGDGGNGNARSAPDDVADDTLESSSVVPGSIAANTSVAGSAASSMRVGAMAQLERVLGRELPLQHRSNVRADGGAPGDAGDDATSADGSAVPLLHIVLSKADIGRIHDAETLQFLQDNSQQFLKYIGGRAPEQTARSRGGSTAGSDAGPAVRNMMTESQTRTLLGSSRGASAGVRRSHGAGDVDALVQQLTDDIATFITGMDDDGAVYHIATDAETGELCIPIDENDGNDDDHHVVRDRDLVAAFGEDEFAGYADDDEGGDGTLALGEAAAARAAGQLPPSGAVDASAGEASNFALALLRKRRDGVPIPAPRPASGAADDDDDDGDGDVAVAPRNDVDDDDVDDDAVVPECVESPTSVAAILGEHKRRRSSIPLASAPAAPPAAGAVKLFTPSLRPPNKRIANLLKFAATTRGDKQPGFMQSTAARRGKAGKQGGADDDAGKKAAQQEQQPGATSGDEPETEGSKHNTSSMSAAAAVNSSMARRSAEGAAAYVGKADPSKAVVVRSQRPKLSDAEERRLDWLLDADDWQTSVTPVPVTGSFVDPASLAPANQGFVPPAESVQRIVDIDKLLAAFGSARMGALYDNGAVRPDAAGAASEQPAGGDEDGVVDECADVVAVAEEDAPPAAAASLKLSPSRDHAEQPHIGTPRKQATNTTASLSPSVPVQKKPAFGSSPASKKSVAAAGGTASTAATAVVPITAAAEERRAAEAKAKAAGNRFMREFREEREQRVKLQGINDRLARINAEVGVLFTAEFNVNHKMEMHRDPALMKWGALDAGDAPPLGKENGGGDTLEVRPPSPDAIAVLLEQARREAILSSRKYPAPAAVVQPMLPSEAAAAVFAASRPIEVDDDEIVPI